VIPTANVREVCVGVMVSEREASRELCEVAYVSSVLIEDRVFKK
jgi:hypothetical protein